MTSLSVISKGFLAALIVGSVALWLTVIMIRRRRARLAIAGIAVFAAITSLASVADAVNAHYQYLPRLSDVIGQRDWPTVSRTQLGSVDLAASGGQPVSDTPTPTTASPSQTRAPGTTSSRGAQRRTVSAAAAHPLGAVVSVSVTDRGVGFHAGTALVYLPPQYFSEPVRRFPVVYLLHGSPGIPIDWLRGADAAKAGAAAAAAGKPQILVMPHVSRDWLDDSECVDGSRMLVETYVVHDLVPAIDAQLRTMPDRGHRAVGGMSAGGYCALNLGLRNRDVFGQIIDMSGFTHPTHSGGMAALFGRRDDLAQLVAANSPDRYVDALPTRPLVQLYLLCGTSDRSALRELTAMRDRLVSRGFSVSWHTRPGGHTYGVWRPGLADALAWNPAAG